MSRHYLPDLGIDFREYFRQSPTAVTALTPATQAVFIAVLLRKDELHQSGGFFVTRAKSNTNFQRVRSTPIDRSTGLICDQGIMLKNFYAAKDYPGQLRRVRYKDPQTEKPLAGRALLQVDQTASADQAILRYFRERREEPSMDRRRHLCAGGDCPKATEAGTVVACDVAGFERDAFRENPFIAAVF